MNVDNKLQMCDIMIDEEIIACINADISNGENEEIDQQELICSTDQIIFFLLSIDFVSTKVTLKGKNNIKIISFLSYH